MTIAHAVRSASVGQAEKIKRNALGVERRRRLTAVYQARNKTRNPAPFRPIRLGHAQMSSLTSHASTITVMRARSIEIDFSRSD